MLLFLAMFTSTYTKTSLGVVYIHLVCCNEKAHFSFVIVGVVVVVVVVVKKDHRIISRKLSSFYRL